MQIDTNQMMDIDSKELIDRPFVLPEIKEVDIKNYTADVDVKGIKSMSESDLHVDNINKHVLLQIPTIDNKQNLLYATGFLEFYKNSQTKRICNEILHPTAPNANMIIATSGSGKTSACLEVAKNKKALYFDCCEDLDFSYIIAQIKLQANDNIEIFTAECVAYYVVLILVREQLLEKILQQTISGGLDSDAGNNNWKYFSLQRTIGFQTLCKSIIIELQSRFKFMINSAARLNSEVIILDEANWLLNVHENKFPSSDSQIFRPLLYPLVKCNKEFSYVKTIYAGTHVSIKDHALIASGASGGKVEKLKIQSRFDFNTFETIQTLLKGVLTPQAFGFLEKEKSLLGWCCWVLQGRVRTFAAFLQRLANYKQEKSDLMDLDIPDEQKFDEETEMLQFIKGFRIVLNDYVDLMTDSQGSAEKISMYSFWERARSKILFPMEGSQPNPADAVPVISALVECLFNYYYLDEENEERKLSYKVDLVDSALIRLHVIEEKMRFEYTMAEPLALLAGFNFLRVNFPAHDYLGNLLVTRMTATGTTAQAFGDNFELLVALRTIQGWWIQIPDNDEVWNDLDPELKNSIQDLRAPKFVFRQKGKGPIDYSMMNFIWDSHYYILPDKNLGPDGLWKFMSFNLKTSQGTHVSSEECKKNYKFTDIENWCKKDDTKRRNNFKDILKKIHLVHFQIEFPFSNPKNKKKKVEKLHDRTIIHVDINSPWAKHIFGEEVLKRLINSNSRWMSKANLS